MISLVIPVNNAWIVLNVVSVTLLYNRSYIWKRNQKQRGVLWLAQHLQQPQERHVLTLDVGHTSRILVRFAEDSGVNNHHGVRVAHVS